MHTRCLSALFVALVLVSGVPAVSQQTEPAPAVPAPPSAASAPQPAHPPAAAAEAPAPSLAELDKANASLRARLNDFAGLKRYQAENAAFVAAAPGRVVFYGDSITEGWARHPDLFFPGKPYLGRGISGQTTPQMLIRFRQDVVALHPETVVILAGTNDIAGNTGPSTLEMIEDNLASMAEIAHANGIRVVLASVLPAADYRWRPGLEPAPKIRTLNAWIADYCKAHKLVYLDYWTALADANGGMREGLSSDGVHPTPAGYAIMAPLAEKAIAEARHEHVH